MVLQRIADIGSEFLSAAAVAGVLAIGLSSCAAPGSVSGSVTPRPDQETTLIIHVVPARQMIDAGHRSGPGPADARAYAYRVKIGSRVICGLTFGDDILAGGPGSMSKIDWELSNCNGKGGDYP